MEHVEQGEKRDAPRESCCWEKGITAETPFLLCSQSWEDTQKRALMCQLGGGGWEVSVPWGEVRGPAP